MPQTEQESLELWREQSRRQMERPLSTRLMFGFVRAANREQVNRCFSAMAD